MPNGHQRHLDIVDNRRKSVRTWQDRIRNPSLTALLVLELCALFLAAPLAAKGLPIARVVADALCLQRQLEGGGDILGLHRGAQLPGHDIAI